VQLTKALQLRRGAKSLSGPQHRQNVDLVASGDAPDELVVTDLSAEVRAQR
jgi:hypothetical protein